MPSSFTNPTPTKAYAAPKLTIYGHASRLTASGTGTVTENTQGGGCQANQNRRPC